MKSHTLLVGVVGISGSGKTTVANQIVKKLRADKQQVAYIRTDHYYKDVDHLPKKEFDEYDFDQPEAIDMDGLYQDLKKLLNHEPIDRRLYSFHITPEDDKSSKVIPAPIVVIEGLFLLTDERIRNLFSLIFLVDTPLDCAIVRRIQREVDNHHGAERTLATYESQVRPAAFQHVLNFKKYAHHLLSNENAEIRAASVENAVTMIKSKLSKEDSVRQMMKYAPVLFGLGLFAINAITSSTEKATIAPKI